MLEKDVERSGVDADGAASSLDTTSTSGQPDNFGLKLPPGLQLARHEGTDDLVLSFSHPAVHPADPLSWSPKYRGYVTLLAATIVFDGALSSTAPSGATNAISETFGTSETATLLVLSLFLVGYCTGPILWAPLSEAIGRRYVFVMGTAALAAFSAGCAAVNTFSGLLILRFLAGVCGAMPATNSGSVCGDVWPPKTRGFAMSFYSICTFAGPALGPLVGGYSTYASYKWCFAALSILSAILCALCWLSIPETYPPLLLRREAKRLRLELGDERITSRMDLDARKAAHLPTTARLASRASVIFGRPFVMFCTELILFCVSVYMAFAYGLIYLTFAGFPLVWEGVYGLGPGTGGLPFLSVLVGAVVSVPVNLWYQQRYQASVRRAGGPVDPELRLPQAAVGGLAIAVSFFWFGWTGYSGDVSIWAPISSGVVLGLGNVLIFRSLQTYIIDAYQDYSASAQCANVIFRSLAGAVFPLFARPMFDKLGINWACTLLGGIMLALVPIPLLFYRYGHYLRRNSRYCPSK